MPKFKFNNKFLEYLEDEISFNETLNYECDNEALEIIQDLQIRDEELNLKLRSKYQEE